MRPGAKGSSASTGTPILPPIWASRPALLSRWAISAVVVDLPLVPVMATSGQSAPDFARSRQNNSMSPMISTPALPASAAVQCGCGMGERHAGRQHQRGDARPIERVQVLRPDAGGLRFGKLFGLIVEGDDLRAAGFQRTRRQ